ncbi:RNA polymerase sigma factor [Pelotomaculum propionicicum]|uniref:RNA polymerase sigma factor n=1 Tax=Pelotomaculum propionicicum TaxID=258475 RepID=UPI003B7F055A
MNDCNEHKKAGKGDLKSIEQLCLATWEPLYRFIYYRVQNREEAEDITQETYARSLPYLRENKVPSQNFPGFMRNVALNVLRDRWRQKKRRGTPVNIEEADLAAAAEMDCQNTVAQRLRVENALAGLGKDQRAVLDLRIIKGYTVAETARLLGKTEAAVRTSQYRALQTLARLLDDND